MRICGKCGAKLTGLSPSGLCPRCFLQEGLTPPAADDMAAPGADQASSSPPPPARVHSFGDYELLREVACGGMGIVYQARQISLNRMVALKMILAGQLASEAAVKRFHTEAKAAASLDHPHIVSIYEVGQYEGQHYFTMQFVEGQSLETEGRRTEDRGRKSEDGLPSVETLGGTKEGGGRTAGPGPRAVAQLLAKVARAVHYAHQQGILHRDLKPANILVDACGEPHVTDFGLAKVAAGDSDLTMSGMVMGTPNYMSPEQAAGKVKELTPATDIYSLGAVLYYLLARRPPFEGATPLEVMRKVLDEDPAPPTHSRRRRQGQEALPANIRGQRSEGRGRRSEVGRQRVEVSSQKTAIDRDLETICLKCLEKDPARRYATAQALAEDLERWMRSEPIQARPGGPWGRVVKWVRRKPALAGWAIAAVLVTLLGLAGILWHWREDGRHATEQRQQRAVVNATTVRLEMEQTDTYFRQGRVATAVARLAHSLRRHPDQRVIAERLLSALSAGDVSSSPMAAPAALTLEKGPEVRPLQPLALAFVHSAKRPSGVYWAEFSPDGQRVVTASADGTARVWDVRSGRPVTESLGHQAGVRVARFSPDGRRVATASDDATARVWDAGTGQPITSPLEHAHRVVEVRFSPDGRWILTASWDGSARVWNASTGQPIGQPMQCGESPRPSLEDEALAAEFGESVLDEAIDGFTALFSPDNRRVVTTCPAGGIQLWDPVSGQRIGEPLPHPDAAALLRFSPDSTRLVTVSGDGTACVWDTLTGQALAEPVAPAKGLCNALPGFSPDGCQAITLTGNTAQLWDLRTGHPVGSPMMHTNRLVTAQFGPDGSHLALASTDGMVRIWDVQAAVRVTGPLWHGGEVRHVEFSADGRWLLTACLDGQARLWEVPAAPAPIPRWLPDLAEAAVGQRFTDNDVRETVPTERLQSLRQQLTGRADTNFYTRWAEWFFAPNKATRTLSPSSLVTVPQYVAWQIAKDTVESLHEALRLAPTNALALARLSLVTLAQSEAENPQRVEESGLLLQRTMPLAPDESAVRRARAHWLDCTGLSAEALALVEEGLQIQPDSAELWLAQGELLEKAKRLEEANQAYTQALKMAGNEAALRPLRLRLLQQRSDVLWRLEHPAESLADYRTLLESAYPTAKECRHRAWLNLFGPPVQRNPPERTLLLAEKAVRLDPKDWRNLRILGMAQYRQGQFSAALESFQIEGRLRQGRLSPHTLLYLALTHHQLHQPDQAKHYFEQAETWWKKTFEQLDRSRAKGEADNTVDTPARKRRYGETAWAMQIKQITRIEDVYARLGLPVQAELWALRSEVERVLGMPMYKHKWKIVSVSYEVPWIVGCAAGAIDENPVTLWHTCPRESEKILPHEIVVDLGEMLELTAFTYLPRPDDYLDGIIDQYEFYLSTDGQDWNEPVAQGTFANLKANRSMRIVPFAQPVTARYFRFVGLHAVSANHLRLAELGVVEK